MSNQFKEKTGLPRFILVLFFFQFVFFILYTLTNSDDKSLLYFSIGILLLGIFLAFFSLVVVIDKNKITYKLFPFINKSIDWNEVKEVEIVKISALSDFLGWGIRFSKKYGWGYITNTEYGLFIHKMNDKKIVLSIKNKDELIAFLETNNIINQLHIKEPS